MPEFARRLRRTLLMSCAALCAGCVYLPPITGAEPSHAYPPDPGSRLAQALQTTVADPPKVTLVDDAHLALTTRLDLIDAADHSLDLQYFIWQNDPSGILVIKKCWRRQTAACASALCWTMCRWRGWSPV